MADDDDFEDLFSFGASEPVASSERTKTPTSTFSDYDILNDVSTPGGVIALGQIPRLGVEAGANVSGAAQSKSSSVPKPRLEGGEDDDFDALFGTPPVTPDTSSSKPSPLDAAAAGGLLPPNPIDDDQRNKLHHENLSMIDDFHVHDEETRDMLEWLDDDNTGNKISSNIVLGDSEGGLPYLNNDNDDDDFDFDQLLTDVDVASSPRRVANDRKNANEVGELQVNTEAADTLPESATINESVASHTYDSIPTSFLTPPFSTSIEKDLSLDQWDDEHEELEDLQLVSDAVIDAQHEAKENRASEGSITTDSSPGHEDVDATKVEPINPQKKSFSSLADAIRSNQSTAEDVRSLFARERSIHNESIGVSKEDRAHLWAKIICGKIVEDIENGSLAESYREWDIKWKFPPKFEDGEFGAMITSILNESSGTRKEDAIDETKKRQLMSLSHFHCCNKSTSSPSLGIDSLIPPVALAILETGLPPASASVVLSHIEPSAMPLLRLAHEERYLAAKTLHSEFYLLACYHLPLLVMHLDRHCPGWYWPKDHDSNPHSHVDGKDDSTGEGADGQPQESTLKDHQKCDLDQNGLVPLSWFVTNFAGEIGGSCLNHGILLQLWDHLLTEGDHSWKYFLAIAVLDKKSDLLLMSRGEELKRDLEKILNFQEDTASSESFVGSNMSKQEPISCDEMTRDWLTGAKSLKDSTPSSVIELLRSADDRAVASAIQVRQTKLDQELQAQIEEHEEAQRREQEERRKESDREVNKARLIAYYRTYNPEKIDTIEQILKMFDGRMDVLNEKLTKKYGKGFIPDDALKDHTRSFFMSVSQSIKETRNHVSGAMSVQRKKNAKIPTEIRSHTPVVLEVSATEVIPVICTTKFHHLSSGNTASFPKLASYSGSNLHFYLVDCRPESIALEQGRFPTAVAFSPEKLQDPDELQTLTDMFESLRGTVHICVMGEGFASFPILYNHSLSRVEEKLLEDDEARTSNCALFFLKKGFPFVSVLRGGFAAAHAYLSRNCPETAVGLDRILIDFDPDVSLFAQLETARQEEEKYKNASAREKTARTLQKIIDNSMVRLTLEEQRINNLASELAKPETVDKMKQSVSNFLAKPKALIKRDQAPKNIDCQLQEESGNPNTTFKLPSLYSDSSSMALSTRSSGIVEEDNGTNSDSKPAGVASVPATAESDKANATESASKISNAFTSLTQRIHHSTAEEESTNEHNAATSSNVGGKFSFSNLRMASTLGKSITFHSSPKEEEKVGKGTVPSAHAPLSQSEATKGTMSLSSFTKKLKFAREEPKNPANHTEVWKFSKLTKSLGDSISELREKAVDSKLTDDKNDNVTAEATEDKKDGGSFTKLSKSVSAFSGIQKQPFASILQSKSESIGEESEISKKLVALGKFLTEDEPRPKTRWQRIAEEEAISFDKESTGTKSASTDASNEDCKQTSLFSKPDAESSKDMFADVSLSSSDENLEP